jgi:hypothetical protein
MASTHADLLPRPAAVTLRDVSVMRQSSRGAIMQTVRPDTALKPRSWQLDWATTNGAVADAVLRHFDDHRLETWTFKLPRTGELVTVRWMGCPQVRWRTSQVAESITGQIMETLAHE